MSSTVLGEDKGLFLNVIKSDQDDTIASLSVSQSVNEISHSDSSIGRSEDSNSSRASTESHDPPVSDLVTSFICSNNPSSTIHYMANSTGMEQSLCNTSPPELQNVQPTQIISNDVASTPMAHHYSNIAADETPSCQHPCDSGVSYMSNSCPNFSLPSTASTSSPRSILPSSSDSISTACVICNDRSSGRHYGVISCEGCKGFFKRTVRRQILYTCRADGVCSVDRRKRTRCQACRYSRCIRMGMKREAVQEERVRPRKITRITKHLSLPAPLAQATPIAHYSSSSSSSTPPEVGSQPSTSGSNNPPILSMHQALSTEKELLEIYSGNARPNRMNRRRGILLNLSLAALLSAELNSDAETSLNDSIDYAYMDIGSEDKNSPLYHICNSAEQQIPRLIKWAQRLPYFCKPYLSLDDQLWLIRSAWAELLIISAAFNSIIVGEGLLLATGRHLSRAMARQNGLGPLMDRFLFEFVNRFREFDLERIELALLRAIVVFNPDANNLVQRRHVETVRESLYAALYSYCRHKRPEDRTRFSRLMLRLPSLRSFAHKCLEHLVIVKLAAEDPASRRLLDFVENGAWPPNDPFTSNTASTSNVESPPQ